MNPFAQYEISKARDLVIEFQGENGSDIENIKVINAYNEDQLFLKFSQKFSAMKTTGRWRRKIKEKALDFSYNYTTLSQDVLDEIGIHFAPAAIKTSLNFLVFHFSRPVSSVKISISAFGR